MTNDDILSVLAASKDLVSVADLSLQVQWVSDGAREILGYDPADVVGTSGLDFYHPDDVGLFASVVSQITRDRYTPRTYSLFRLRHADGSYVTLEVLGGLVESDGEPVGFWMVGRPPRRSEVYADVLHSLLDELPLARALEPIPEAMFPEVGAKVCITCWPSSEPIFTVGDRLPPSLTGRVRLPGTLWDHAVRTRTSVARDSLDELDPATAKLAAREGLDSVLVLPIRAFGADINATLTIWGEIGSPPAGSLERLAELAADLVAAALRVRGRLDDLSRTARSDALTGLANRAAFEEALAANATASHVAILYIDLDRFKAVNDTFGHLVGDQLLEVVARRMLREVRTVDLMARLGGDEFAVLCPGCDPDEAVRIAERIITTVTEPVVVDGHELHVGASVGVAHSAVYVDDLLRRADDALYDAKNAGRGTVRVSDA